MAQLPRYQGGQVQLGQSGTAMAYRAQANTIDSFVQGIQGLKSGVIQQMANVSATEGEAQAIIDVADGKLKQESLWTAYGKAYNNASQAAYQANVSLDMKNTATKLATEYKNEPEKFRAAFDAYGKKTIAGVQSELNQAITGVAFKQYGDAAYAKLTTDKQASIDASNKKSLEAYVNLMQDDYMAATTSGDFVRSANALTNINALYAQMVNQNYISEGEVAYANTQLQSKAYTQFTLSEFNNAVDKTDFIDKFQQDKHPMLNATQISELDKALKARIKSDNAMYKEEQDMEEFDIIQTQTDTERAYNNSLISGTLNQDALDQSFKVGELSFSAYDRLSKGVANPGISYDHEPTYLKTSRYLAEMSDDEIVAQDNLTYKTRRQLLADRKVALTKRLKWTTTENGREALRRVKSKFGILEGTLMAKIDFENTNMKNYDKMHQALYDELMELPEDQREDKALNIATRLINKYEGNEASKQAEQKEIRERKIKETAQNKANTFNSGYFELFKQNVFGTEKKPWEEMLPKKYEYLGE